MHGIWSLQVDSFDKHQVSLNEYYEYKLLIMYIPEFITRAYYVFLLYIQSAPNFYKLHLQHICLYITSWVINHTSTQKGKFNTTTPWISPMLDIVSYTECTQIGTWLCTSKEIFIVNRFLKPGDTSKYTSTHNVPGSFAMVKYGCWLLNWGTVECTYPAGKGVGLNLFSLVGVAGVNWAWHNKDHFEGILPKGPYLPSTSG